MRQSCAAAILAVALAGGALLGIPGTGFPVRAQPRLAGIPFTLNADEVTADNTGTKLVARGHVAMTYKTGRATADLLHFNRSTRVAVLSGHVTVTDPQGRASGDSVTLYLTHDDQVSRMVALGNAGVEAPEYALTADQIDADRRSDRLAAEGHVTMFSAPDLIATGDRARYDRRTRYAVVTGHPVVENRAGRVIGDWIELFRAKDRAVVHGPVEAEVYGATITGAEAAVDLRRATAVIRGHVMITRRQGILQADQVTIFYEAQRIIAEGTTHMTFADLGGSAQP